jgi:hypothetical protein
VSASGTSVKRFEQICYLDTVLYISIIMYYYICHAQLECLILHLGTDKLMTIGKFDNHIRNIGELRSHNSNPEDNFLEGAGQIVRLS